jgi:hypothetical protein
MLSGHQHYTCESLFSTSYGSTYKTSHHLTTNLANPNSVVQGPNPQTGGFCFAPVRLFELYSLTSGSDYYNYFIGTLPGLLTPLQQTSNGILPHGHIFTGSDGIKCVAGKLGLNSTSGNIAFTLNDWE